MPAENGEAWEVCIAALKWATRGGRKHSRSRILRSLKDHQVSGLLFVDAPFADVVLLVKRRDLAYYEVASIIEKAILVELGERVHAVVKPLSAWKDAVVRAERLLKDLKEKKQ